MQPLGGWRSATAMSQRPDGQIALHAVANGPANDTARIQIQYDGEIQPSLTGP